MSKTEVYRGWGNTPYTREEAEDRMRRMKADSHDTDFSLRCMGEEPRFREELSIQEIGPNQYQVVKTYIPR